MANSRYLLAATTDVVITDIVEVGFLVFTLDGYRTRQGCLDDSHTIADETSVALSDRVVNRIM